MGRTSLQQRGDGRDSWRAGGLGVGERRISGVGGRGSRAGDRLVEGVVRSNGKELSGRIHGVVEDEDLGERRGWEDERPHEGKIWPHEGKMSPHEGR